MSESTNTSVLEPLNFDVSLSDDASSYSNQSTAGQTSLQKTSMIFCILCDRAYCLPVDKDDLLKHMAMSHKLVISDVQSIVDLGKYLTYWKDRLTVTGTTLADICSVIRTNSKQTDPAPSELYYLLCDNLPEDRELRMKVQRERLDEVLAMQQKERDDVGFSRVCLFCTRHFRGNRAELFHHMAEYHCFNVGHPDNLVYTEELLETIADKLRHLKCLYCEKTFKDAPVLKEHMRKKGHKRLHSGNLEYNRFYMVNYLEFGKNWKDIEAERDDDIQESDDDDSMAEAGTSSWNDWDEPCRMETVCLFCDFKSTEASFVFEHLVQCHGFNLSNLKAELNLTFYQQVKLVNYIRRQLHQNCCTYCGEKFHDHDGVLGHLNSTGHITKVPAISMWDQAEYFFPTYENDNLLCALQDEADVCQPSNVDTLVIAEDSLLSDAFTKQRLSSDCK